MFKKILVVLLSMLIVACTTNALTGRQQFIMFAPSQDKALGANALAEARKSMDILTSGPLVERVNRIAPKIVAATGRSDFDWEFMVVDEDVLNAWALPGGKVAIYSKMVSALDDNELAAVLGHEAAHAVLRHGAEQVSRAQAQNTAILVLGAVVAGSSEDPDMAKLAVSLGSLAAAGLVQLPHSRKMELEADHIGTVFMAKAGYDPRAAVSLWQKMSEMKGEGGGPPAFLSTHPTDTKRIERLSAKMPEYLAIWEE